MPITPSLLTYGIDTANTSQAVSATFTPTTGSLVLVHVNSRSTSTQAPVLSGLGATWVSVGGSLYGTAGPGSTLSRIALFRAMGSGIGSGSLTISFTTLAQSIQWHISQYTGVSTASTDGAGAIVQTVAKSTFGVGIVHISLAAPASTNNLTVGAWGQERNQAWTTLFGAASLAATFAEQNSMLTAYILNSSRISATDNEGASAGQRAAVGVELAERTQTVQELSGSISVPTSATANVQVVHNLGGTASVGTSASGQIQPIGGHFLTGAVTVPIVVSQNVGLEHKLQAVQAVASVVVLGDLRQVAEDVFTRTAVDFGFVGHLNTRIGKRMSHRKLENESSPRYSKELTVTTSSTSIDLKPFANAKYSVLIPTATNTVPYRLASDTDAGVLLSGASPSLISLSPGTTAMHLYTSVSSASIPVRLRVL